jgi:Major capsid protein N-terminus/Large eukaryotic DNA virus major capsid protein
MSGGIVQLVSTGAQDAWLTGKPEVSFYRSSYKRYTHYARSSERQLIQGAPTAGSISTIRFEKKGDLINSVYLIAKDTTGALVPQVGWSNVIDKVELLIGGQIIDTQDINWMSNVEPVVGAQTFSTRFLNNNSNGPTSAVNGFLPLKFFFNKDWNVSLPLVALQYHDIELRITWSSSLATGTVPQTWNGTTLASAAVSSLQYEAWCNFVYLDQAEREYFANTPMDMLITQVNRIPIGSGNMQELALAHPIKYITFNANNYTQAYLNATTALPPANYQFKTQINGVDIGDSRSMFQWIDVPQYYFTPFGYSHNQSTANVAIISYCLDTSKLQPTGSLNFSRIDTYRIVAPAGVSLQTLAGGTGKYFYAVNYNVLRIKDGMAGLLYSN